MSEGAAGPRPLIVWLRRLLVGLVLLWAAAIALVFALRLTFPLELEWMEGGTLQQAWRVQQGLPVYGPPSRDFVPFLYTPLYPALVAALGWVFPLGYPLARAISIVSVAAICAALWSACAFEAKPRAHRAAAVGLFLAGYVFSFRWLDVARADALFLALLLWGLVLLRQSQGSWRKAALAGLLVALAFWTKQTAAVFVIASGLAALIVAPRQLWAYAGTIALVDGGGVLLGQWISEGWLWIWIYEMHQSHAFNDERFWSKTWGMFLHAAPFLALLLLTTLGAGAGLLLRRARQTWRAIQASPAADGRARAWARALALGIRGAAGPLYWGLLLIAALLVSALGYSTQYAEPNAFIPGVCFGALFFALTLPDSAAEGPLLAGLQGPRRALEAIGLVLMIAQLGFALLLEPSYQPIQNQGWRAGWRSSYIAQDPWRTIPRPQQRAEAWALRRTIEGLDPAQGELLALHRPWWSQLAGGPGHIGAMGINDVSAEQAKAIQAQLREELLAGRYQAVWVEGSVPRWIHRALRSWVIAERRWGDRRVRPLSGWMSEAGMVTPWRGEQLLLVPPHPRVVPGGVEVIADFEDGSLGGFETEGEAFGRVSSRSRNRRLPLIGPHGGARLLSSANSKRGLRAQGSARSPSFVLPAGGAVELMLGSSGERAGLSAQLRSESGERAPLKIPRTRFDLRSLRWPVPAAWAGRRVWLELRDESGRAAVFVDDLWLWRTSSPPL